MVIASISGFGLSVHWNKPCGGVTKKDVLAPAMFRGSDITPERSIGCRSASDKNSLVGPRGTEIA